MARYAVRGDRRMVDIRGLPRGRYMARFAPLRRRNMVDALSAGEHAVVTRRAAFGRLCVIESDDRLPFRRELAMARLASIAGHQPLIMFSTLAARVGAIVAREATIENIRVIDGRR